MPVGILDTVGGDLPLPVGGGVAIGVPPSDVDVLVDRVPFWLGITVDTPYQRETAQFQRDQVDQQPEAGEQSLVGWWTRAQMSFHFGAGLNYLDTTARPTPEDRLRFKTSRNVDVWTPGVVRRLNGTTLDHSTPAGERLWVEAIDGGMIAASQSKVERWDGTTWTVCNYGSPLAIKAFAIDGASYYVATVDGVYKGPVTGATTATKVYDLPGTNVPMCLGWAKQRLMLGHGPKVYSLDAAGPALPTAQMTHPVASWTWTFFTDSPQGILAAGYAGLASAVYRFGIEEVSGAPVLGAGITLMTLPAGEQALCGLFYIGAELIIGTNRGVRICPFNSYYGSVSMGPLTVLTEAPVTALGGFDRYVWAGTLVGGETSCVRVDLSAPLDDAGHYAWAPDLVFPTGAWTEPITAIAFHSTGRKVIGVKSRGLVTENDGTDPSDAAWLQTARIRMGTVEDKHWVYGRVRGTYSSAAPIGISLATPNEGTFTSVYVATTSTERFALRGSPGEWVALRFDFSEGAELASYQVQALPASPRQRLVSLPLHLFDYETTRSGIRVGYPGWGLERLHDVEALERAGAPITVAAPALFPEAVLGVIERLVYLQPYDTGDQGRGTGGQLQLVLRVTS